MTPRIVRVAFALTLVAACAFAAPGAEVVVLKDGFVVQGNPRKEVERVTDKATGVSVPIVKNSSYDMIDEGPKTTIFSTHARQPGVVGPDVKLRPATKGYSQKFTGIKSSHDLPAAGTTTKVGEFNAKWVRQLFVTTPDSRAETVIDQQIVYMDPYYIDVFSATHKWRLTFRTAEWDAKQVRKLLMMHPELAESDGKCDPLKRVALAKFLLDAGWLQFAKDEVDRLKRDFTGEMAKDAKEQYEALLKDIDQNTAERYAREAELSLAAGRYKYTRDLLAQFPEKTAGAKEVARVARVTAELKTGQERYDTGRRLLRSIIDEVRGMGTVNARVAACGGLALATWVPPKGATGQTLDLAAAGEQVYAELHQDSAVRIETFVTLASEAERARAQGRGPTKKPEELLATAVSGWARGKNGASTDPETAWRLWAAREAVLAYQRAETLNDRTAVLGRYKKNIALGTDELAQIISLLPPAVPEDLLNRTGKPVPLGAVRESGIYRRTTLPVAGYATGVDYLVKLPPEYHHGRAYPVLIVLPSPGANPEDMLAPLAAEADRYGYILVVPEWTSMFGRGWEWKGDDHIFVTAALRDAVRHVTVDNDRVFMIGFGDGANMAMDVGMSHPDLFAGVIPMGPVPKWNGVFMYYWQNAQKLPFYVVTGAQSVDSLTNLKRIYDNWMPLGFPAMMSVYKGRGLEWYSAETPVFFDWMSRKARANGTSTLAGLTGPRKPWVTHRETDNHFYWLQVDGIDPKNLQRPNGYPAEIIGDIRGNNIVDVRSRGVTRVTLWLSNDMIDWSKPVVVRLNGGTPNGYRPKVLEPNLEVLLEDYYERGDRRMLYLNKLEFATIP
ncbi:MAG: hypothetical protein J0I06_16195 [Planctomycetes bacterium]|nr:hypothetical protein [Planctomycetota bacterium]